MGQEREHRMARKTNRRQQIENEPTREVQDRAAPSELPAGETEPAGEKTLEYTELVLLGHANSLPEAELVKAELQAHGIPALLEGEGARTGIPDVGAGVPVLVPEEFADQAAELIAELESAKSAIRPARYGSVWIGEDDDLEDDEILDQREGDLEDVDEEDIDELDSLDDDDDWDEDDEDDEDEDDWDDDDDDL